MGAFPAGRASRKSSSVKRSSFCFGRLYIARSRSPTPTTFVTRVVRVWKDAIEPPTVGQVYSKLPDSKPSSPESPYGTGLYPHLYSCTCTRVQ